MVALSGKGEGTSFTSAYMRAAENLHAAVSKFSFSEKHDAEFTVFDFISNVDGKILKNLPNKPFYLPIVSASMQDLVSYLSSAFSAEQAISVLQAAPSFEIFVSYRNFASPSGSSISLFAEIIKGDSLHRAGLKERFASLESGIQVEFSKARAKIESIGPEYYSSFDANFLASLDRLLERDSTITQRKTEFTDLSALRSGAESKLLLLESDFSSLKGMDYGGNLPLGKKTSLLEQILIYAEKLSGDISFLADEGLESIELLCTGRISGIETSAKSLETFPEISYLKSSLIYGISKYNSSNSRKERLLLCKNILETNNSILLAVSNLDEFKLVQKNELDSCTKKLDTLF